MSNEPATAQELLAAPFHELLDARAQEFVGKTELNYYHREH